MTKWPSVWVTKWPSELLTIWPIDWVIKWPNDWVTGWQEASQTIDRMAYFGIEIDHKIVAKSELEQNTRLENSHCWLVTTVTSVTITINYTWQNPAACHYSSFTPVGVRYEQTGTLQDHNNDNYNWSALTVGTCIISDILVQTSDVPCAMCRVGCC